MTISPNGQLLAAEINNQIHVLETQTMELLYQLPEIEVTNDRLALSNSGTLVVLNREGNINIWNSTGEFIDIVDTENTISDIAFSFDGKLVVAYFLEGGNLPLEIWQLNQ